MQPVQPVQSQALQNDINSPAGSKTESGRAAASAARNQTTDNTRSNGQIDNRLSAQPLTAENQTQQGLTRELNIPPSQQSKTYAALQERLQLQQSGEPVSDEQANADLRRLTQAQGAEGADAAEAPTGQAPAGPGSRNRTAPPAVKGQPAPKPGVAQPGAKADKPAVPAAATKSPAPAAKPAVPAVKRPAPLRIKSLAEGVQAKGLHDLLADAEELMRAGKFASAIDKYAAAEQVAPNNPLMRLGRAHAELGATRYGSAEQHIRDAIDADPALLMGQYDLEAFMGRDRLGFLITDLKQMAQTEATSPRPMLLLAYIAYGMPGQEAAASEYLNDAATRAIGADPLIESMKKHWVLDAAPAPARRRRPSKRRKSPK